MKHLKELLEQSFNSKRCDYEFTINRNLYPIICFNSKRCDYECKGRGYGNKVHKFQFQKVRLWVDNLIVSGCVTTVSIPKGAIMRKRPTWLAYVAMHVSIPKGAIMRGLIITYATASNMVSIPKGAIMRLTDKFDAGHFFSFNSKRCDYEHVFSIRAIIASACFNSKRCDYEIMKTIEFNGEPSFNSKRCDYETVDPFAQIRLNKFQFQKVRLWVDIFNIIITFALFQFQKVRLWDEDNDIIITPVDCFNSKRCDYEIAIRHFSIERNMFQFQKVRLWEHSDTLV